MVLILNIPANAQITAITAQGSIRISALPMLSATNALSVRLYTAAISSDRLITESEVVMASDSAEILPRDPASREFEISDPHIITAAKASSIPTVIVSPSSTERKLKRKEGSETQRREKKSPTDYTLVDLCGEIGMDPVKARKLLRAKGKKPPEGTWKWPNREAAKDIRRFLKKS